MVKNLKLLDKALQLLPEVKETVVEPLDIAAFLKPLKKGDSVEIDFGRHLVVLFLEGFLHDSEHGIQHFFSVLLLHLGLGANRLGDICFGDGFAHGFFSGISLC